MIIEVENLTFNTIIGILDFERLSPQKVVINLKAKYDYSKNEYLNYVELVELIEDTMKKEKFELLEDALLTLKELIFQKYPKINSLYLKITKPDILDNCEVSLSNEWKNI